jgi:transmembrane sensor
MMVSGNEQHLLVSYILNELNDEEKKYVEDTLRLNPELRDRLNKIRQVWYQAGLIHEINSIDLTKEWDVFKKLTRTIDTVKLQQEDKKPSGRFTLWLTAASFLLLIGFSSLLYMFRISKQPQQTGNINYTFFKVPAGQHGEIILPDGTKVWLNARSMLSYANSFALHDRNVSLVGEAFFEVSHNEQLPFHVNTPKISINVVGTVFNLSAYPNAPKVETALLSGSICITDKTSSYTTLIKPHEKATLHVNTGQLSIQHFTADVYSSMKNGEFTFFNEPAEDVLLKLEQFFDIHFVYEPALIHPKRLTARFRKGESLEKILQVTGEALDLKFIILNTTVKVTEYKRNKNAPHN